MSDKYRVKFQSTREPLENGIALDEFDTAEVAQAYCDRWTNIWQGIYTFEVVPPYTPPAITAEMDLETRAGSPGCVDGDDLLGVKPPC